MSDSKSYFVGVDTGGTYTDAVIIERGNHRILASAKALTTKGDLSIGVKEALSAVMALLPEGAKASDIAMVSVSTTLATNAVVEGMAARSGCFLLALISKWPIAPESPRLSPACP